MASQSAYYLQLLNARGELVESFPPAALSSIVKLATERVADFDKYSTVYRVIRLTKGLYARPFTLLPALVPKKLPNSFIVQIVSADLYHSIPRPK